MRKWIERTVGLIVAACVLEAWFLEGFPVPCRVQGNSMAETLLGTHYAMTCPDCGYQYFCGADLPTDDLRPVCPNCGYWQQTAPTAAELAGDRVLIDRSAYAFGKAQRWDVAAFHRPAQGESLVVKRVVGLPGESVQIRHGDVYVHGQIQRKTLRQQRAMRILVHDADFEPTLEPRPPSRWRGETDAAGWDRVGGRWAHPESARRQNPIDWLIYHHWQRGNSPGEAITCPVTDICGYNQGRPRREEDVHAVPDVMLQVRIEAAFGRGVLWFRATDGAEEFLTRLDPAEQSYKVFRRSLRDTRPAEKVHPPEGCGNESLPSPAGRGAGGEGMAGKDASTRGRPHPNPLPEGEGTGGSPHPRPPLDGGVTVVATGRLPGRLDGMTLEISLFDQQFLLAINGRAMATLPYDLGDGNANPPTEPLAVGSQGLGLVLRTLRVYRDVYFTRPIGPGQPGNFDPINILRGDEYFVVGDNSPISQDSRAWRPDEAVTEDLFLGRALLVVLPSREMSVGDTHFQVPDLNRIRYIR
jgi:signal peptidase I